MFNKAIQELTKIAPKWNIRPTLAGLYFKWNKIAVTDSFRLMEVTLRDYETEELPIPTNKIKYLKSEDIDFIIPTESIKNIKIPKVKNFDFLNKAYFCNKNTTEDGEVQNVWIVTNDLDREVITQTRVLKSKFPDYESFFENDWTLEVWMDATYLMELCQIFQKLWHNQLKFTFWKPLQKVIIEWTPTEEIESTRAILMPLKI